MMAAAFHSIYASIFPTDVAAAHLPLALLLIFGTGKLLAEVLERLGQPGIIGEILAGILLGPSVLNWIRPDHVLAALAELGAMFLLFRVGLEVKASELFRMGGTALTVAVSGVIVPLLAGWGIASYSGYTLTAALFVGSAMVATSVGITARVLASKGLLELRASRIILAAAVIDDVLGLVILAFVSSFGQGKLNVASLATTAVLALAFTFVVARFGSSALERLVPKLEERLSVKEAQFNIALVLLFGLSFLAVYIGVAAIVGAFLAGVAFSETVNRRVQDLAHGITELLVPFFLANIGLQLNLAAFSDKKTILLSILILLAALGTKFVGCGLGAMRLGKTDAVRVGVGMIPRGEVGMVVAQVGIQLGIIQQPLYAAVVFMAVGTTLAVPPLLKYTFRNSVTKVSQETFSFG